MLVPHDATSLALRTPQANWALKSGYKTLVLGLFVLTCNIEPVSRDGFCYTNKPRNSSRLPGRVLVSARIPNRQICLSSIGIYGYRSFVSPLMRWWELQRMGTVSYNNRNFSKQYENGWRWHCRLFEGGFSGSVGGTAGKLRKGESSIL